MVGTFKLRCKLLRSTSSKSVRHRRIFCWGIYIIYVMNILDILFPKRCVECGKFGNYICDKCRGKIVFVDKPICPVCEKEAIDGITHPGCCMKWNMDGLYAAVYYSDVMKNIIHNIKYQFVSDIVPFIADYLFPKIPPNLQKLDLLVPVPLHWKREKERGFNQSLLIARILKKKFNIPVASKVLIRNKYSRPQADLKRKERLKNLKDIFSCININLIKNKNIGLVDDVATTCATLRECAKVLKKSGAKTVWGIVLAHGN